MSQPGDLVPGPQGSQGQHGPATWPTAGWMLGLRATGDVHWPTTFLQGLPAPTPTAANSREHTSSGSEFRAVLARAQVQMTGCGPCSDLPLCCCGGEEAGLTAAAPGSPMPAPAFPIPGTLSRPKAQQSRETPGTSQTHRRRLWPEGTVAREPESDSLQGWKLTRE